MSRESRQAKTGRKPLSCLSRERGGSTGARTSQERNDTV